MINISLSNLDKPSKAFIYVATEMLVRNAKISWDVLKKTTSFSDNNVIPDYELNGKLGGITIVVYTKDNSTMGKQIVIDKYMHDKLIASNSIPYNGFNWAYINSCVPSWETDNNFNWSVIESSNTSILGDIDALKRLKELMNKGM